MKLTQLTFTFLLIAGLTMAFPYDLQKQKTSLSTKEAALIKKAALDT